MEDIIQQIRKLKEEKNAVILAHNYVRAEIQDIADFSGDSLELSIQAEKIKAPLIVFCGVRFMAETAKLLSPDSVVLLPNSAAGCPMADMADDESVKQYRLEHPDTMLVAYVNSTVRTKAYVDMCCTSGNVEKVLDSIPAGQKVMFLPDRNLGANMNNAKQRGMELWNGCCPIHNAVTVQMIRSSRAAHPGALVLVHPECSPEIVAECDAALSTGGILRYVRESGHKEFVIGTECGILHRLRKENPDKTFYSIQPELVCVDMKKITLEDVRDALLYEREKIELPREIMQDARKPIDRMLALNK